MPEGMEAAARSMRLLYVDVKDREQGVVSRPIVLIKRRVQGGLEGPGAPPAALRAYSTRQYTYVTGTDDITCRIVSLNL
jgi:hypothetical protein